jgi:hypothetical protein
MLPENQQPFIHTKERTMRRMFCKMGCLLVLIFLTGSMGRVAVAEEVVHI